MKDRNLEEIFLERVSTKMKNFKDGQKDYRLRRMAQSLHEEFDNVWLDYLDNKVTYEQWNKSLDNWLNAELLAK